MSMPDLPCEIECFDCGHRESCSEVDPDTGMSEMRHHIYRAHAQKDGRGVKDALRLTADLLAKVVVAPDA